MDDFSLPFKSDLPQTKDSISSSNMPSSYLPIRTRGKNIFDEDVVIGYVLSGLLRKKIVNYSFDKFRIDCMSNFKRKIDNSEFLPLLDEMYFNNDEFFKISPELLLLKGQKSNDGGNKRHASLFLNLMQGLQIESFNTNINFLESEIIEVLRLKMEPAKKDDFQLGISSYLPFLSDTFRKDIKFLSKSPKYLLDQIKPFLRMYAFLYTSQLALSVSDWKKGESPLTKPLYFIMDHERASHERFHVMNHGFRLFNRNCYKLFPYLTVLEMLQSDEKLPLWKLASRFKENKNETSCSRLEQFARAFKSKRNLQVKLYESNDLLVWLEQLLKLSIAQFEDKSTNRPKINSDYVKDVEKFLASDFVINRRRAGKILVLNQDYVLLLTNIAIGERHKLRFQELIAEFRKRGVYLDKQTEIELIKFFERIGNVEKMSDSGDAVYVRKTI